MSLGKIYLIGAGPGDPELITVRGLRLLRAADVVAHDRLVDRRLLREARVDARLVDVGKLPGGGAAQGRINGLLVSEAKRGNVVVRLKGGDPFVFGRGGEEALALRESGVPFEIVPGVTSAVAAPAFAGIPLTHRGVASSFTVFSGSRAGDGSAAPTDWDALARVPGTLVALMAWRNLREIADSLIAAGKSPHTPAAVVSAGSHPAQKTASANLDSIADAAEARGLSSPAVLVVGEVARLREALRWFETLPLFGRRVLVTRAPEQASELSERLAALGALPVEIPTIRTAALDDRSELDAALANLSQFDWIAFTSANAVRFVFDRLSAAGADARALSSRKNRGDRRRHRVRPRRARGVGGFHPRPRRLRRRGGRHGEARRLRRARPPAALRPRRRPTARPSAAGGRARLAKWSPIALKLPESSRPALAAALEAGVDAVVFASASAAVNLVALLDGDVRRLDGAAIACVGRATAAAASELGLNVDIVAQAPTAQALAHDLAARLAPSE